MYRAACFGAALDYRGKGKEGRITTRVMFYTPTKRRSDLDNRLAQIKAGLDGMCKAIGIDDSQLRPITLDMAVDKTNPRVEVYLEI